MEHKPIQDRKSAEINEVGKIARFYGFQPINPPPVEKQDIEATKDFDESSYPMEKAALLRMYFEDRLMSLPQPNMFYCERPFHGMKDMVGGRKKPLHLESSLISLGSSKSVCECLSIQTAISILNSIGYKNLVVEINSIGDKDSMNDFQKKLTVFIRKNYNAFSTELKQATKKDLFTIFKVNKQEWESFQAECPRSIDFLSESSRLHFKEVLEFLEIMDTPYQINHHLIGDLDIGSETIFSIKTETENDSTKQEELAYGFRFNRMAKKIGLKKDVWCSVLNISAKVTASKAKQTLKKVKSKTPKPQFYLVQFGLEAKLKSFIILQELYKAGVNIVHSITKDKLGGQMEMAESSEAPYIILIGQKEALENSVVIRNTQTRAQETVPIAELTAKAKKLV